MKRLAPALSILLLTLPSSGCRLRPGPPGTAAEQADRKAFQALAKNHVEIRQRIEGAQIEVPGTGTQVHLAGGRGRGPGTPPAWNVEVRRLAGVVPTAHGVDVFADVAIHRSLKAPDCYLALFHLDKTQTAYTSAVSLGAGARVVEATAKAPEGDAYRLKIEYLDRAPLGDFLSNPSVRKQRLIEVANHAFLDAPAPPTATHS